MLFDLKGRRRRLVQATYLILAVLMGGGLVLFGIGGDVSGGLVDAITGGSSGSSNSIINDRIKKEEKAASANPKSQAPVKELIRDNYQLATENQDQNGVYGKDGKKALGQVARWWERYTVIVKKPDGAVARYAILAYGPSGLNQASQAADTAELFAESQPQKDAASAYLQLSACATLAGQTRKADLAGNKAVQLTPKKQRKSVEGIVAQAKNAQTAKQICGQG